MRARTGLVIDAYFSATKVRWILDQVPGAQKRAEAGELLCGTIDTWLVWKLTGGRVHVTDVSNASRTMVFDIHRAAWDDELLRALDLPRALFATTVRSSGVVGDTDPAHFGKAIPISGIAGDQQAALFGQTCFAAGEAKNTYGTGCFLLVNTGGAATEAPRGLLTTVAWDIGAGVRYALEGSAFITGAAVQWLRDGLGIIATAAETEALAASLSGNDNVYLVPAFTGLGAPHWDPYARGMLVGIERGTTRAHLARATLEAIAYQTRDLVETIRAAGTPISALTRRRRRYRERVPHAAAGRSARDPGRGRGRARDDRARRRVPRGPRRRDLEGRGRSAKTPRGVGAVRAADERGRARRAVRRLEARGRARPAIWDPARRSQVR